LFEKEVKMLDKYQAVGKRIAVYLPHLGISIPRERVVVTLSEAGFHFLEVDISQLAREQVGVSIYKIGCLFSLAPQTVDCSSFVKWLYGQMGIWLPRLSVQQHEWGSVVEDLLPGDLLFTGRRSRRSFYRHDPEEEVGHVGMVVDSNTIIHAANPRKGVVETSVTSFTGSSRFRGARRYLPTNPSDLLVLEVPQDQEVETEDDIRWFLLKKLGKEL
jgi:hypothetical protein